MNMKTCRWCWSPFDAGTGSTLFGAGVMCSRCCLIMDEVVRCRNDTLHRQLVTLIFWYPPNEERKAFLDAMFDVVNHFRSARLARGDFS